jgi:hypothetical protein
MNSALSLSSLVGGICLLTIFSANKPAAAVPVTTAAAVDKSQPAAKPRFRCETCGVVEGLHRTEAGDGLPATYLFTVRMRDGSSRLSSDANSGKWRIGDHIMLIGGASGRT